MKKTVTIEITYTDGTKKTVEQDVNFLRGFAHDMEGDPKVAKWSVEC